MPEELVAEAGDKPGFVAAGFDWRGIGAFDERARRASRAERAGGFIWRGDGWFAVCRV
jgi:hypothetical protein